MVMVEERLLQFILWLLQSLGLRLIDVKFGFIRRIVVWLQTRSDQEHDKFYAEMNKQIDAESQTNDIVKEDLKDVTSDDLEAIYNLAIEGFGEINSQYGKRKDLFNLWYEISPDSFKLIKDGDIPVGYCIIFPIENGTFRKYISKKESQFSFDENDIKTTIKEDDSNYIFIQGIYIKPEYAKKRAVYSRLVTAMYSLISKFSNQQQPRNNILVAEAVSVNGRSMLERYGFSRIESDISFDDNPIYHLDFSEKSQERYDVLHAKKVKRHLAIICSLL